MQWAKITLSADDVTQGRHFQLQDAFERMFMAAVGPKDAAMFVDRDFADPNDYYFSPGARKIFDAILRTYGAVDCAPPQFGAVTLLVGHADAAQVLLSSRRNNAGQ